MSLFPRLRAGSAPWLVRHEVRMFSHGLGFGATKAGAARSKPRTRTIVFSALVLILLHAAAIAIVMGVNKLGATVLPQAAMIVTLALAIVLTLMLSMALKGCVESLYERGDLDLLLSSPLPSRTILATRLLGIAAGTAAPILILLTPLANVGLFAGHANWMALYPVIASMGLIAAAGGMLATLALVRLIGVRRTRTTAQILAALSGAFVFLLTQGFNLSTPSLRAKVAGWVGPLLAADGPLGPDSLAWLPGRALTGSPLALLALIAVGVAAYALTAALTHRLFVRGVLHAGAMAAPPKPARSAPLRFRGGVTQAIVRKEWRLILRDPQLIVQVLMQLLYLLPMVVLIFKSDSPSLPGIATAMTMVTLMLTASIAWLVIAAEDAPDLLATAPLGHGRVRRAKLIAVVTPPMLLLTPVFAWVGLHQPLAALLMLGMVGAGAFAIAQICLWCGKPAARESFKTRAKGNGMMTVLEMLCSASWSALVFSVLLAVTGPAPHKYALIGAAVALLAAACVQGLAWALRVRRD